MSWIACMAHIAHENSEFINGYIDNRFTDYIIAYETSEVVGEHIHFVLWAENKNDYHNLCQAVFKKKFSLRGKATKGKCRQYGKVKKIETINKMMAYTVKDQNVVYKLGEHLKPEDIKLAFDSSYKKEEKLDKYNNLMKKYIANVKETQTLGYFTNRNDFTEAIIKNYWEIFEKLPGRAFILNQIYKYEKNTTWYMCKTGTYTEPDTLYYRMDNLGKS